MIPSEVWTLIGVVIGAILGFALNFLREYINERKERRKYLEDLLADLEWNKKLAKERKGFGYHTLGYTDAKGAKYLFELPAELRNQLYDAISLIFYLNQTFNYTNRGVSLAEKLEKLLENIIPQFREHLKNKKI
jgi:hypothetical protein